MFDLLELKMKYYDIKGFEHIYLEDSYVLKIFEQSTEKSLVFSMELVLTEKHPSYTLAKKSEQYCYKNADIIFTDAYSIVWITKDFKPNINRDGTMDFGNIDSFIVLEDEYHLLGEWGEVIIKSKKLPTIFIQDI